LVVGTEANKAIVRRHFEAVVNQANLDNIEEWVSPDFLDHEAPPGHAHGPASVRYTVDGQRAGFPDWSVTVDDIVAEGDRVVVRNTWRGTHHGVWRDIAPTGRTVTYTGMVMWRLADGKIVERWASIDRLSILRQLGAIPAEEQAAR
jgi:predicted ester cyclase